MLSTWDNQMIPQTEYEKVLHESLVKIIGFVDMWECGIPHYVALANILKEAKLALTWPRATGVKADPGKAWRESLRPNDAVLHHTDIRSDGVWKSS